MGNYTGNPDNFPTAVAEYDDAVPPGAAQFNPAIEGGQDQAAYLAARAFAAPLVSLQAPVSTGGPFAGGTAPYAYCWNDRSYGFNSEISAQGWLITGYNAGITVFTTTGTDTTWTQVGATVVAGNPADAIEVSAATGTIWLAEHDGTHINTWRNPPGVGWTVVGSNLVTTCTDAALAPAPSTSGSAMYIAAGSSTAGDALLGFTTDAGGVTLLAGFTATKWLLKSNGSYAIAIPKQAAAPQQAFKSNAAGGVWAVNAIGLANNTDVPFSLAWNAVRGLWILAVSVTGGRNTAFYTSPDGVVWTLKSTLTNVNWSGASLTGGAVAANGPHFFFLDNDGNGTPSMRLLVSVNGGVTWYAMPIRLVGSAASNQPRIRSGANMLAVAPALDPAGGAGSSNIRFSLICGKGITPST